MVKNEKNINDSVTSFRKEYSFLSNMYSYKTDIFYNGYHYNCVETAYQAQKDPSLTESFSKISNPCFAKRKGSRIKNIRPDWNEVKVGIMEDLVRYKFNNNERLKEKLLSTGDKKLVEGNDWGDTFWGVCNGEGLNKLGEILMKIRDELKENKNSSYNL